MAPAIKRKLKIDLHTHSGKATDKRWSSVRIVERIIDLLCCNDIVIDDESDHWYIEDPRGEMIELMR